MEILIVVGLILLNGLLAMAEIALVSSRKARLEIELKKGEKLARTALNLTANPDKFLSTIQIGITLIGILTGLFSGEAFAEDLAGVLADIAWLQPYALPVAKLVIVMTVTYLTLVLGELVPKRIGMRFAEKVAIVTARPMNLLSVVASPFVWILSKSTYLVMLLLGLDRIEENKVTEDEIKAVVKEGFDGGEVQEVEQDIVERVFILGDRNVGSIMTHRSDIAWMEIKDSPESVHEKVKTHPFNIYPVASERFDNIVGVAYLKDLFGRIDSPDFTLSQVLRAPQFVPENQSVYKALEQFRKARVKYGLVTDEFGGIQGIVTLRDIMEALIGQMFDVGEEQEIKKRTDDSWLVDGQYSFYNFLEYFDLEDLYAEYDYNTLSGLILEILECVPKTGDKLTWKEFDFEIVAMDKARIDKVLVRRSAKTSNNDE
ncbi:MAG: hemolysin family protein [Tannerella sp.]|jgi:putative hemolysin|nr:hemolysin family protein [Tannerella sp.]